MEALIADLMEKDSRLRRYVQYSKIPLNTYYTHRFEKFEPRSGAEEALQLAQQFAEGKASHFFILFAGEPGTGKTHLALSIGWYWLLNNKGLVQYWQVESLLDELRGGFNASSDEVRYNFDELLRRVKNVDLLILDDLGVEKTTEWTLAKLDGIVDNRYINQLETVVTTNLKPSKLEKRLESRLREGMVTLLECDDYRRRKKNGRSYG